MVPLTSSPSVKVAAMRATMTAGFAQASRLGRPAPNGIPVQGREQREGDEADHCSGAYEPSRRVTMAAPSRACRRRHGPQRLTGVTARAAWVVTRLVGRARCSRAYAARGGALGRRGGWARWWPPSWPGSGWSCSSGGIAWPLEALGREHGHETAVAGLDGLAGVLVPGDVLLSCVGPFDTVGDDRCPRRRSGVG